MDRPGSSNNIEMTREELLLKGDEWSLACDQALLNRLRDFSENLVKSSQEITENCDSLSNEISTLGFKVANTSNEFLMIGNSQFVENCVQEFEECNLPSTASVIPEPIPQTKAEKEAALIAKMKQAIQIGVRVQQERADLKSVSLEESVGSTTSKFSNSVNLAHLIGSSKFFSSRYCGLKNENRYDSSREAVNSSYPSSTNSSLSKFDGETNLPQKAPFIDVPADVFQNESTQPQYLQQPGVGNYNDLGGTPSPNPSPSLYDSSLYPNDKVLPDEDDDFKPKHKSKGRVDSQDVYNPHTNPKPKYLIDTRISQPQFFPVPTKPPSTPSSASSNSSSFFDDSPTNNFSSRIFPNEETPSQPELQTEPEPEFRNSHLVDVSESESDDDIFKSSFKPKTAHQNLINELQARAKKMSSSTSTPDESQTKSIPNQQKQVETEPESKIKPAQSSSGSVKVNNNLSPSTKDAVNHNVPPLKASSQQQVKTKPVLSTSNTKPNLNDDLFATVQNQHTTSQDSPSVNNVSQSNYSSASKVAAPQVKDAVVSPPRAKTSVPASKTKEFSAPSPTKQSTSVVSSKIVPKQEEQQVPAKLPQPKSTKKEPVVKKSIFDTSDSDSDDLFSTIKIPKASKEITKPKTSLSKGAPSNNNGFFDDVVTSRPKPPPVLDLSDTDDDDIFKSLDSNKRKIGIQSTDTIVSTPPKQEKSISAPQRKDQIDVPSKAESSATMPQPQAMKTTTTTAPTVAKIQVKKSIFDSSDSDSDDLFSTKNLKSSKVLPQKPSSNSIFDKVNSRPPPPALNLSESESDSDIFKPSVKPKTPHQNLINELQARNKKKSLEKSPTDVKQPVQEVPKTIKSESQPTNSAESTLEPATKVTTTSSKISSPTPSLGLINNNKVINKPEATRDTKAPSIFVSSKTETDLFDETESQQSKSDLFSNTETRSPPTDLFSEGTQSSTVSPSTKLASDLLFTSKSSTPNLYSDSNPLSTSKSDLFSDDQRLPSKFSEKQPSKIAAVSDNEPSKTDLLSKEEASKSDLFKEEEEAPKIGLLSKEAPKTGLLSKEEASKSDLFKEEEDETPKIGLLSKEAPKTGLLSKEVAPKSDLLSKQDTPKIDLLSKREGSKTDLFSNKELSKTDLFAEEEPTKVPTKTDLFAEEKPTKTVLFADEPSKVDLFVENSTSTADFLSDRQPPPLNSKSDLFFEDDSESVNSDLFSETEKPSIKSQNSSTRQASVPVSKSKQDLFTESKSQQSTSEQDVFTKTISQNKASDIFFDDEVTQPTSNAKKQVTTQKAKVEDNSDIFYHNVPEPPKFTPKPKKITNSIFDSSDSDDDLFSSKSKTNLKTSSSNKGLFSSSRIDSRPPPILDMDSDSDSDDLFKVKVLDDSKRNKLASSENSSFSSTKQQYTDSPEVDVAENVLDSLSFDDILFPKNVLPCMTKNRPKISHSRRPKLRHSSSLQKPMSTQELNLDPFA